MRALRATFAAIAIFVVSVPLLMLAGAFGVRLLLGASTYRSSGAWLVVIAAALAAAAAISVTAFRGLTGRDR